MVFEKTNEVEEKKEIKKRLINDQILAHVMDKSNNFWAVKFVHASGHGGQHKDHGNSKAQLTFDVEKFFVEFDPDNKKWERFVEVFGKKNIHHDNTKVIMDNQEERSAQRNEEKILHHLRGLLSEVLEDGKVKKDTKIPYHEKGKKNGG